MLVADIKFNDDSIKRCNGSINSDGSVKPWLNKADVERHIKKVNSNGHRLKLVQIVT